MEKTKQDLLYWSKRLYQKGMSPATSGNISARVNGGILISATGVCLNDMSVDDLILIDFEGNLIEGKKKPSNEKFLHLDIYEKRDDIKAIIHSHCPYITAYAVANLPIETPIMPEFVCHFNKIPLAPYATPSGFELAEVTSKYFNHGHNTVLMANHGVVCGEETLQECFYNLEALRAYCETSFGAVVLGGAKKLNQKQIKEIEKLKG